MDIARVLPRVTLAIIAITAVLAGPVGPLDLTTGSNSCAEDVPIGTGTASITPVSVPEEATLTKSEFGAEVYRFDVDDATVNVSTVEGRPLIVYRIHVPKLGRTIGTTTVLSYCTIGTRSLSLDTATFEPDKVADKEYDATIKLVYRGSDNGADVAETLVSKNITVEVDE